MSTLIEQAAENWFSPKNLSEDENEAIIAGLEALFAKKELGPDYPFELSQLIKNVVGPNRLIATINAGDGSLMRAFDTAYCFGIESDPSQSRRRQGSYQAVVGAYAYLAPLFDGIERKLYDTILDLSHGEVDASFLLTEAIVDRNDNLLFVLDYGDENATVIEEKLGRAACEVVVSDEDWRLYVFPDPAKHDAPEKAPQRFTDAGNLDLIAPWIAEKLTEAKRPHTYTYRNANIAYGTTVAQALKAIHREYGRRYLRDEQSWDVELYGGHFLNFVPSEWTKLALTALGRGDLQGRLHKRDVSYFAQNSGFWEELLTLEDRGVLLIDPIVKAKVFPIVELAYQVRTPLRPLKPQERIGYLSEQAEIKCLKDDEARGFVAGRYYRVALREIPYEKTFNTTEARKGVLEDVKKKRRYLHQLITIDGRQNFYDDNAEDIKYLLSYFEVKDPGDIRTRFPELYRAKREVVEAVEAKYLTPRGLALKEYQRDDIARLLTKDRAILAWEQGLGKSPGGLTFSMAASFAFAQSKGKELPTLIIAPQDLIPQWKAEARKFYGIELTHIGRHKGGKARKVIAGGEEQNITSASIKNLIEAREIAEELKSNPYKGGFYITHYEALSGANARGMRKIEEPYVVRRETRQRWVKPGYFTDENGQRRYRNGEYQDYEVEITSAQECPWCGGEMFGLTCRRKKVSGIQQTQENRDNGEFLDKLHDSKNRCGFTRISYALPTIGSILSTAFSKGTIIVDEGTQIASARNSTEKDSSQKTKAVCGLRAKHRLVMSGTPVKNFIAQAYWLLWWGIGNNSQRFPYKYAGGKKDFAKDFTVLEWTYNEDTDGWNNVKEVGEVTNHSKLWAQLASVLLRRVKEQTGELIPPKKIHVIHTPLGYYQREQMEFWLEHFPEFFVEKHPEKAAKKNNIGEANARLLGLDHKLNYASVLPKADPDFDWTGVSVSNFTPAVLKTLETVMALVKQGRQVLVGTDVKKATPWLAARLAEKGVNVRTMLKQDGSGDTLDPADRAQVVIDFQEGKMDALVSTQKAIRLGHNLDKGSAVVFLGLDWDYETWAQFRDRVHRLTSENPIDVYIVIPGEKNLTLVGRKWDVIQDKAKGAAMAIDGSLPESHDEPIDKAAVIREMMDKGIKATGDEVLESEVAEAWRNTPHVATFELPAGFEEAQAKPWTIDWDTANACLAEYLEEQAEIEMLEAAYEENSIREGLAWLEPFVEEAAITSVCLFLNHFGSSEQLAEEEANELNLGGEAEIREAVEEFEVPARPTTEEEFSELPVFDPSILEPDNQEDSPPAVVEPDPTPEPVQTIAVVDTSKIIAQLKELGELKELGVLTEDEFNAAKGVLLTQMRAAASAQPSTTTEDEPQLALAV